MHRKRQHFPYPGRILVCLSYWWKLCRFLNANILKQINMHSKTLRLNSIMFICVKSCPLSVHITNSLHAQLQIYLLSAFWYFRIYWILSQNVSHYFFLICSHYFNFNFLISARSVTERRPNLLTPVGSTSTKVELRGNTLLLECIAGGVWVIFLPPKFSSKYKEK